MQQLTQTPKFIHLEPSFDGLHRAGAVAGHALEEVEASLLVQDGVGGPETDILSKHTSLL